MSSGNRRIRINTQERAVSTDINRLQQFQNQDLGEFLRYFLNVGTSDDDPGQSNEATTLGTPLSAEVVNGLMVRPIAGNFSLTVDAGMLCAIAPDAVVDDSNYKFVRDPGVPSAGVLALGSNSSGAIRIDVVECRVNPVDATVSDSRDIFNPSTGLFSATSVTKEIKGQLEFRVRAGTPGAGYPAAASGWLPLCVASVPDGAGSNNDVTFWDVRPMISDRQNGPMNDDKADRLLDLDYQLYRVDATHSYIEGTFHAVLAGRRVGGAFLNTVPGTSALLNVADTNNQDSGTIIEPLPAQQMIFVYVATPFGLPRWARYSDGPSGRTPRGPKGLIIVSQTPPTETGAPSSGLTLPPNTGLGATATSNAICCALAHDDNGGQFGAVHCANRTVTFFDTMFVTGAYAVLDPGSIDFHVTDTFWPRNAKELFAECLVTLTIGAGASNAVTNDISVYANDAGTGDATFTGGAPQLVFNHGGAPVNVAYGTGVVRFQLPEQKAGSGEAMTSPRYVKYQVTNTGLVTSGEQFNVYAMRI